MDLLYQAIENALSASVLVYTIFGVFLGITVGAIPGLSGDLAIALLLPLIYKVSPASAIGMLIGIYKGSMFGGSISAILFGVPGTAGAAATVEDGYKARLNGHPNQALLTSLYSSFTGDIFSDLVLIFLAIPMASIALQFGPVEFFALYVFALMLIALLTQGKMKKGMISAAIGLLIGSIGMDPIVGTPRLTFGLSQLRGGIPLIPLLVGSFALSEMLIQFSKEWRKSVSKKMNEVSRQGIFIEYDPGKDKMNLKIFLSTLKATFFGAGVGTFVGALPGAGSSLAAFMSYGIARRFSRHPERFGNGSLEGVAAPEAANSATCGSTFIPLFAFGIPGSATAALFGAALIMQGINPGPRMIAENTLIIYSLFVILIYANFINLGLSRLLIPVYAKLSMIQARYLIPVIFLLATLGTFASRNSIIDVWILLLAGVLGVVMRKNGFPLAPMVLAFIIGPGTERALRQSLLIGRSNWIFLLKSPIAVGLYAATFILLIVLNIVFRRNSTSTGRESCANDS